jgi:prepilin-type N-terminal cleavage/methylation domain-containing protein
MRAATITPCRFQQGFTLLEGLIALSVLTGLLVLGNYYTRQRLEEALAQQAAAHLRLVTAAAVRYVEDGYDQLGSLAEQEAWRTSQRQLQKEHAPVSLEVWRYQELLEKKYLLELYQRSKRNLYGQGYALYIIETESPNPRKQLLVLTTGGKALQEKALQQIARQAGGLGGYISKQNPDSVTGSQQGWQIKLPAETAYQPQPNGKQQYEQHGHLACLHTIYPDDLLRTNQLLHRTAQDGKPELNQMESNLKMQSHQISFTGKNSKATGSLSAQGLQFERDPQQKIDFGYDARTERAQLRLKDAQGSVVMTATHVTATNRSDEAMDVPYKTSTGERTAGKISIKEYSAPELNAYWNKVPYYELSSTMSRTPVKEVGEWFADSLCSKDSKLGKLNKAALGRFFMIGHTDSKTTFLYLCSHGTTQNAVAHLLSQFSPEANQANCPRSDSP